MLIELLVFCLVAGLIIYLLGMLPLPEPWKTVIRVVVIVIFIVYLLEFLPHGGDRGLLMFYGGYLG
jgi:hypothetical protein